MYERILQSIGLAPKEVVVYQALMKLGETSIKPLLRETGLKRGNLYDILYGLEKKGLCHLTVVRKKTRFRPASPHNLVELAEAERDRIGAAAKQLMDIVPRLNEQFKVASSKPFVAYFEGIDGLKKVYKLILERKQPINILASYVDRSNQTLRALIEEQKHKQKLHGIQHRAIVQRRPAPPTEEQRLEYKKFGIEVRQLNNFNLPSQIIIFGDSVAISALAPQLLTTYIENKAIATTMNIVFDQLWEKALNL